MNYYSWKGIDSNGQLRSGNLLAPSEQKLQELLLKENIALFEFKIKKNFDWSLFSFNKISREQLILFFQQLAFLINNGVQLTEALKIVQNQIESQYFKNIISQIYTDVQSGKSLSESMKKEKTVFNNFIIQMIHAGENSAKLGFVLENLTLYLEKRSSLIKNFKQAAFMPIIIFTFALFIIFGIFIFLVPQFETFFSSFSYELPTNTKFVINISKFLRSWGLLYIPLFFILFIFIFKFLSNQIYFKKLKDKFLLQVYFFDKIFLLYDLISFLQTTIMFLSSGFQLKQSLENSANIIQNSIFKNKIDLIIKLVLDGKSLHESFLFVGTKYFPQNLIALVAIGEKTGNLEHVLKQSYILLDQELNAKLKFILTVFQPILMLFIGLIIAFLMLAVYMPIFNMASIF